MTYKQRPKKKLTQYILVINIFYIIFFFLIIHNSTGGFGNISAYINSIFYFPIFILLISFIFKSFKDKVIFCYLSFVVFGATIINEFNISSMSLTSLIRLLLLILTPFILALLSFILNNSFRKLTGEK